jgi:hypothetical protein
MGPSFLDFSLFLTPKMIKQIKPASSIDLSPTLINMTEFISAVALNHQNQKTIHKRTKCCTGLKDFMLSNLSIKNLPHRLLMELLSCLESKCYHELGLVNTLPDALSEDGTQRLIETICLCLCGKVPPKQGTEAMYQEFILAMEKAAEVQCFSFDKNDFFM